MSRQGYRGLRGEVYREISSCGRPVTSLSRAGRVGATSGRSGKPLGLGWTLSGLAWGSACSIWEITVSWILEYTAAHCWKPLKDTVQNLYPDGDGPPWRHKTISTINPHKTISTEIISTVSARKLSGKLNSWVLVAHDKVSPKWWWQGTRTTVRVALARVQSCDEDWMGAQLRFFMGKRCLRSRVWWRDSRAVVSISTEKQHELIHIHRTILHGRRTTCLSGAGSELYHSSVYYLRLLYITDIIIMTPTWHSLKFCTVPDFKN